MDHRSWSNRVVLVFGAATAACAADVRTPVDVGVQQQAMEEIMIEANRLDEGWGGFGNGEIGLWGWGYEVNDWGAQGGAVDADVNAAAAVTTATANLIVELTPELASMMLGILHGIEGGEAAFTMAKATFASQARAVPTTSL